MPAYVIAFDLVSHLYDPKYESLRNAISSHQSGLRLSDTVWLFHSPLDLVCTRKHFEEFLNHGDGLIVFPVKEAAASVTPERAALLEKILKGW